MKSESTTSLNKIPLGGLVAMLMQTARDSFSAIVDMTDTENSATTEQDPLIKDIMTIHLFNIK